MSVHENKWTATEGWGINEKPWAASTPDFSLAHPYPPPPPPHLLSLIKDRILTKNNLVSTARVTLIQRNGQRGRYLIYDNCNVLGYISSLPNLLMVIIVYRVFRNGRSLSSWKPYTLSLSLIRSCMNLPVSPMYTLPHSQGRLILYSILFSWINRILRSY